MEGRSWWHKTLIIWLQYLAVGAVAALSFCAYLTVRQLSFYGLGEAKAGLVLATVFYGVWAWASVGVFFDTYALVREARAANEAARETHQQDNREAQEVDRLKAETRRMIKTMRAAA